MNGRLSLAEKMQRKARRQQQGYLRTAARLLTEMDVHRGVRMRWIALVESYCDDPALLACVKLAQEQVATINVPRRAAKLYAQMVDQGGEP